MAIAFLCILALVVFVGLMNERPFPLEALKFEDARLLPHEDGSVEGFAVRVTNNADVGAKDIKVRIDVFDKDKKRIDGTVVYLHEHVPPKSTRQLYSPYVGISGLPANGEWSFTYTVEGAAKAPPWNPD